MNLPEDLANEEMNMSGGNLPYKWALVFLPVVLLVAAAPAKKAGGKPAAEVPRELGDPAYLPEETRLILRERMVRHANEVSILTFAVTLLEYDIARDAAKRLAMEPKFARPMPDDSESVNNQLPEQFFVLQDEIKLRAQAVSDAAAKKDNKALAASFGKMMETCVSCHAAYLYPDSVR